jgi:hypothetical protein
MFWNSKRHKKPEYKYIQSGETLKVKPYKFNNKVGRQDEGIIKRRSVEINEDPLSLVRRHKAADDNEIPEGAKVIKSHSVDELMSRLREDNNNSSRLARNGAKSAVRRCR